MAIISTTPDITEVAQRTVEKIVEVPKPQIAENSIEVIQVPEVQATEQVVERTVEMIVEFPKPQTHEKAIEIPKKPTQGSIKGPKLQRNIMDAGLSPSTRSRRRRSP